MPACASVQIYHHPACLSAAAALRAALREQPDVLVIEGVATPEVAQLTIDAASQERLVIASVEAARKLVSRGMDELKTRLRDLGYGDFED